MITLFENFNSNPINIRNYIVKQGDEYKLPSFNFNQFSEYFFTHPMYWKPIQYNSIVRFYVYAKLLRYTGDNPTILSYIKGIKDKDKKKIEIINKIPNNNKVMGLINTKFNLGFPNDYNFSNFQELSKLTKNYEEVFSDENLVEYIGKVVGVTEKSDISEKIVKGMLNMLYGKSYDIIKSEMSDDLHDIDLWKINKNTGVRQSIQVKNISGNVKFSLVDDTIYINNTDLDLHTYSAWKDTITYDYLCFYLEKEKKICIIKSTAIMSIFKFSEKRTIRIKLKKWAMEPDFFDKVVKFADVPQKFIGKDVSKIFYNPDDEEPTLF